MAKFENEKFERKFSAFFYNFGKGTSTLHDLGGVLLIFNFIAHVYDKLLEYELFEIWFGNFLNSIFSLSSSPKLNSQNLQFQILLFLAQEKNALKAMSIKSH